MIVHQNDIKTLFMWVYKQCLSLKAPISKHLDLLFVYELNMSISNSLGFNKATHIDELTTQGIFTFWNAIVYHHVLSSAIIF